MGASTYGADPIVGDDQHVVRWPHRQLSVMFVQDDTAMLVLEVLICLLFYPRSSVTFCRQIVVNFGLLLATQESAMVLGVVAVVRAGSLR